MAQITREQIIDLLTNYRSNKRKAVQLTYELEHLQSVTPEEMLEAMIFSRPSEPGGHSGQVSDKTFRIALNYREETAQMNSQTQSALLTVLLPLLRELDRLEHYVRTLDRRQTLVMTRLFFEGHSQEDVAEELGCSARTVRSLKQAAIDVLTEMYQLTEHVI